KGIASIVTSSSSGMISIHCLRYVVSLSSSTFCFFELSCISSSPALFSFKLSCISSSPALFELPSTKSVLKSTNVFTLLKALSVKHLLNKIKRFVLQVFELLFFHILQQSAFFFSLRVVEIILPFLQQTTLLAPLLAVFKPIHEKPQS
ncbi:hypothetical protein Tco_0106501, partial [Tanacetum coccineum]